MADPWLKFYTSDWRADPRLKMCSLAARGLWIEMICLMHEATPYGQLLVSGQFPTDSQLAVLVGARPEQIPELIGELESAGVFSRTRGGVIYSRKMSRMQKKSAIARNNGRKGGNPSLSKQKENQLSDKQKDKGRDKPQKPEARSQKEEDKSSSSQEAEIYQRYLDAHPNPVQSDAGEAFFTALLADGVDPELIIASARSYAVIVRGWSSEAKVQQSDNFLDPDRGKWRAHVPKAKAERATEDETLKFWADRINSAQFIAPSSINPGVARSLIDRGLVTAERMKERGIAA